jgi:hypothetical protein
MTPAAMRTATGGRAAARLRAIDAAAGPSDVVLHMNYLTARSPLNTSPLVQDLAINFEKRHRVFESNRAYGAAWVAALQPGARLFTFAPGNGPKPPGRLSSRFRIESVTGYGGIGSLRLFAWTSVRKP